MVTSKQRGIIATEPVSKINRCTLKYVALICFFIVGCATRSAVIFVEAQIADAQGQPLAACTMTVFDTVDGEEFTIDVSATLKEGILLSFDDRLYRFQISCQAHNKFDTGWIDLRKNRRAGEPLRLGQITLQRQ